MSEDKKESFLSIFWNIFLIGMMAYFIIGLINSKV